VTEVVGPEGHLEPVDGRAPPRQVHHPGVVDQQVHRLRRGDLLGRGGDGRQVGQVEQHRPHLRPRRGGADRADRLLQPGPVSPGQDDAGPVCGKHPGRLQADPAVRTGDQRRAAGLVGDVIRRPVT
jgi:hypothetical protein